MNHPAPEGNGRTNQWAGPREIELRAALEANAVSIDTARQAWADGAFDLEELARQIEGQKEGLARYESQAGRDAARAYTRIHTMVTKRQQEMEDVEAALRASHTAVNDARTAYGKLPPVRPPSDGSLPSAPPMGATKKQKDDFKEELKEKREANSTADGNHEADKRAAEAQAVIALAALNRSLLGAADKMRPVAGMEKPGSGQQPDQGNRPTGVPPGGGQRRRTPPPGTLTNPPDTGTDPTDPDLTGPDLEPIDPVDPPDLDPPDTGTDKPDVIHPDDPKTFPDDDGHLQGGPPITTNPGGPAGPGPVVSGGGTPSAGGTPGAVPIGTGGVTGMPRPVPGTPASSTGRNTIGRSSTAASRGVLGRSGLTPGQSAGMRGAGTRGAAGRGSTRGLASGQSAGARGGKGAGGRGAKGGRGMAAGQSAGRGSGGRRRKDDRRDASGSTYLQDESQWLDDDETGPQTLD